jgi:hypothetical protein
MPQAAANTDGEQQSGQYGNIAGHLWPSKLPRGEDAPDQYTGNEKSHVAKQIQRFTPKSRRQPLAIMIQELIHKSVTGTRVEDVLISAFTAPREDRASQFSPVNSMN